MDFVGELMKAGALCLNEGTDGQGFISPLCAWPGVVLIHRLDVKFPGWSGIISVPEMLFHEQARWLPGFSGANF